MIKKRLFASLPLLLLLIVFSCFGCEGPEEEADPIGNGDTDYDETDSIDGDGPDGYDLGEFAALDPNICTTDNPPDFAGFDPEYQFVRSGSFVQDKNFYLFSLFQKAPEINAALSQDEAFGAISLERDGGFRDAAANCGADTDCHFSALMWSEGEILAASDELARLLANASGTLALIEDHMRPSGMFQLYSQLTDEEMLRSAWSDAIAEITTVFEEYARPLDPSALDAIVRDASESNPEPLLFFEPILMVAIAGLEADGRDEAGRYEPIAEGENRPALEYIPNIDWEVYPFSVILTPGMGPEDPDIPLHPTGKERCDMSAARYESGVAPMIAVSGGHVHPDRTPYSEAIEMKKYLMNTHGIPEKAILVDPHARHTTTNLRNVSRLVLRYGIPANRVVLTTTDMFQSSYIANLDARCLRELGYLPYEMVLPISATDNCLVINPETLHADANDPLDP